jgi:hypothetical protein
LSIQYAKRNGLGYFILQRLETSGCELSDEMESDLHQERQRMGNLRRTLVLLNDISEGLDIELVTIKMPLKIPHIPRDIDIFVPGQNRQKMIDSLIDHGMKADHSSSVETSLRRKGYAKVDIYSSIQYFGFEFLDDDFFAKSTTHSPLFEIDSAVLSEEANLALTLLHDVFGHRSMTVLDYLDLRQILKTMKNVEDSRSIAKRYGWVRTFDLLHSNFLTIDAKVNDENEDVDFPLLFDRDFVLDCISAIDQMDLNVPQKGFIRVSLFLDELISRSKDNGMYDVFRANDYIRRLANSIAHSVRFMRGDRKIS